MTKQPSKFAPVFIASTVVFFLGSALKFVLGSNKGASQQDHQQAKHVQTTGEPSDASTRAEASNASVHEGEPAQEPDEDPLNTL